MQNTVETPTRAVLGHGCLHARCCATRGVRAEFRGGSAVAIHRHSRRHARCRATPGRRRVVRSSLVLAITRQSDDKLDCVWGLTAKIVNRHLKMKMLICQHEGILHHSLSMFEHPMWDQFRVTYVESQTLCSTWAGASTEVVVQAPC